MDKFLIFYNGAKVRRVDLPSRAMFQAIPLLRMSIRKERNMGKVRNI